MFEIQPDVSPHMEESMNYAAMHKAKISVFSDQAQFSCDPWTTMKHETCLEKRSEVSAQSHASCAKVIDCKSASRLTSACRTMANYCEVLARCEKDD
jgi:hypothetical protein